MLFVLWIACLCYTIIGAQDHLTYDEVGDIVDNYETFTDDEILYTEYPEDYSTESYPVDSSMPSATGDPVDTSSISSSTEYSSPEYSSTSDEWYSTESTSDHLDCEEEISDEYHPSEQHPEVKHPMQVGSIRGIPGIHFPDYTDIPLTSFRCSDKVYVPGFYADLDAGCQVFHVCWPHRRESFLCPVGTTFNQAILACDFWYSSNCSLAPHYYDVNADTLHEDTEHQGNLGSMVDTLLEKGHLEPTDEGAFEYVSKKTNTVDLPYVLKFLPVKAKIVVYPESGGRTKIVAEASVGKTKKRKGHKTKPSTIKPDIFEEIEPEYVSDHPHQSPETHQPHTTEEPCESEFEPMHPTPSPAPPHHTRKPYPVDPEYDPVHPTSSVVPPRRTRKPHPVEPEYEPVHPTSIPPRHTKKPYPVEPEYIPDNAHQPPAPHQPHTTEEPCEPEFEPMHPTPSPVPPRHTKESYPVEPEYEPEYQTSSSIPPYHTTKPYPVEPEYEPVRPTPSPHRPHHTKKPYPISSVHKTIVHSYKPKPAYDKIKPSMKKIIDEVFNVAKRIVEEAEGLMPKFVDVVHVHKVKQHDDHSYRHTPMTKLNQRFITKPAEKTKHRVFMKAARPVMKSKIRVHARPHKKVSVHQHVHKPIHSKFYTSHKVNISPLTKKALSSNYLKLLKIKT